MFRSVLRDELNIGTGRSLCDVGAELHVRPAEPHPGTGDANGSAGHVQRGCGHNQPDGGLGEDITVLLIRRAGNMKYGRFPEPSPT